MHARYGWIVVALVACHTSSSPHVDADEPGPFTLTIGNALVDTEVTGTGIACGTNPMACASGRLAQCSVTLAKGTHVSLALQHPVCQNGGIYFAFDWSPPCPAGSQRACEFDITSDATITIGGAEAVR
jgi:hypothetical protein